MEVKLKKTILIFLLIFFSFFTCTTTSYSSFPDVPKNCWYEEALYHLYDLEAVHGFPDGTFGPSKKVSKAQFLKMALYSIFSTCSECITNSPFDDVKPDDWFCRCFGSGKINCIKHNVRAFN